MTLNFFKISLPPYLIPFCLSGDHICETLSPRAQETGKRSLPTHFRLPGQRTSNSICVLTSYTSFCSARKTPWLNEKFTRRPPVLPWPGFLVLWYLQVRGAWTTGLMKLESPNHQNHLPHSLGSCHRSSPLELPSTPVHQRRNQKMQMLL